jgi:hypothetical protein
MRRLHASATTSTLPRRPVPAWRWPDLADWSPAIFLFGVPVVPPGRPATSSPQRADGTAVFSLRMAVIAVVLFFLPTILVLITHAVTLVWERLATRAARQISPLWFADAVARGDFTEAELQADRFFDPANRATGSEGSG